MVWYFNITIFAVCMKSIYIKMLIASPTLLYLATVMTIIMHTNEDTLMPTLVPLKWHFGI